MARKARKKRIDSLGLEALVELRRSAGWALVLARLQKIEDDAIQILVAGAAITNGDHVRGQIAGIRIAKLIPDMLIREGKAHNVGTEDSDS